MSHTSILVRHPGRPAAAIGEPAGSRARPAPLAETARAAVSRLREARTPQSASREQNVAPRPDFRATADPMNGTDREANRTSPAPPAPRKGNVMNAWDW